MTDVHAFCAAMPGAQLSFPFNEEIAVYKVGGKIFALTGVTDVESINLKAEPADVTGLVETHEAITRGFHMNKKHWITVRLTGDLPSGLLEELIEDSYDLIVDKLPARDRP
ncbi:MmcQ/YjbR family DNA-binding protein [Aeromicrobium wangtongii]|uniref:MmcQ/YjbR family DNA-binding protein n=1 Tax=Aeromicrobium wangtongii TaxID=2969247 RepID=A0ABY5MAH7_9ACTN|nr:MmcQ/YjbR family DNA-binding protein [Aeromicrobium wangtongii]MCD9196926.1 MmcQ/YjbR family DNA-binding protein [Aeromicrobium wangtongii]UUP14432.1 MmcQ/YjbR family DNA-binding protein [Aeromicrobium wangtongii]